MNFSKMTKLISNNEYDVFKDPKIDTSFYISLKKSNASLLNSLVRTHIILGSSIIDNYQTLHFKAASLESYEKYKDTLYANNGTKKFPYKTLLKMVYFLSKQLKYLITSEEKCFYEFNPEYIMVIDETKFIYLSGSHLLEMDENHIQIIRPFILNNEKNNIDFVSPELRKIKEIPSNLHFKTIFYSMACLIIFSLTNEIINTDTNIDEMEEKLTSIKETKLYWLIKRCLDIEPEKRVLLLV